jgi:uncharacterized protein (TIGR03790 family)
MRQKISIWGLLVLVAFQTNLIPSVGIAAERKISSNRSPDRVLIVGNANSVISTRIAADYAEKRRVKNILSVRCPDSAVATRNETIAFNSYLAEIESPIRDYLRVHKGIEFIVLTKGIPIRISSAPLGSCDEHSREPVHSRGRPSVDSYLAALDYTNLPGVQVIDITGSGAKGFAFSNRFWNATEPFSHEKFGGYLVTRLDGYTEADAKGLTTQAIVAERGLMEGKILFDVQPAFGTGDHFAQPKPTTGAVILTESPWSEYNWDMQMAHQLLMQRCIPDELDLRETFVGQRTNLAGYFSWGSNDAKFSNAAYQSLCFAPGSFGDTAVSTSARTFLPTEGGQSLLVDLVAHGLTCGKGYVDEPLLQANASPTIAMDRYTSGFTMAESFYAASRFVGWEDIVVGDPLCHRY